MSKIELSVADIHAAVQPSEAFSLILKEKEGNRYVPIIIGMSEARAILVELNQSPTHRPLTHELFVSLSDNFGCSLSEVDIVHFENGVFYADMLMLRADGTIFHLDARPSDAIALALKCNAPFFMNTDIFEQNCMEDEMEDAADEMVDFPEEFTNEEDHISSDEYITHKLMEMTNTELRSLLEGAIESEDFELASKIKMELERRK